MKKKVFLLLFVASLGAPLSMSAQSYGTAVGGRFFDGFGITVKNQVALHTTAEVILQSGIKQQDVTASLLVAQHKSLLSRGLNFYAGGGVYHTWLDSDVAAVDARNPWGISPIVGLEITLFRTLNLSADFKPTIKLVGDGSAFQWHQGISVRYVFTKAYFKNENWKIWKKWGKKK